MKKCLRIGSASWCWRLVIATGILTGAAGPTPAADKPDPTKRAFDPGSVLKVYLALSADEYAAMQPRSNGGFPGFGPAPKAPEKPADPGREVHRNNFGADLPWATGTVTIGEDTFKEVGIRYKGNGTLGDASRTIKKSFKIDLDHFGGTGRFQGSKTINLHCGVADPSKIRETLGYSLYREAGVPVPRTAFAEVWLTVPGKYEKELLGFYTVVEQVDKPFLRSHFGTDKGLLMKPENLREFVDLGDDWDKYKKQYVPKRDATAAEAKRMIAFARLVQKADDATFRKEIGSYLDIDGYLRFLAATAFVANSDAFFTLGHNYHLYLHPTTGRLHIFPWDLDRAYANFMILGSAGQQMDLSMVHPYGGTHRLTERLLAAPGVAEQYQKLLKELSAKCFDPQRLLKELETVEAATRDLITRDAKAVQAHKENGPSGGFGFGKPPALKTFIEKRTASVAAQIAGTSKGHVPTGGSGFGGPPPKMGDIMGGPLMAALDADQDGRLSRDEWLATAKRVFAASEKDKDGRVDQKALAAGLNGMFPKPPEGAPPPPVSLGNIMAGPIMSRADVKKAGKVTAEDLVTAAGKLFDTFDTKKTGKLDDAAFAEMLGELFPVTMFGPPPGPGKSDKRP